MIRFSSLIVGLGRPFFFLFRAWHPIRPPALREQGWRYVKRHSGIANEHERSLRDESSRITCQFSRVESKRREYANLARQFLRLAEEAKRKTSVDRPRLDQSQSELDGPTRSLATTKTRHSVDVFGQQYALHVYQYADNLWIAEGEFLGRQLRTIERTLQKAVRSWQKAAIEKRPSDQDRDAGPAR